MLKYLRIAVTALSLTACVLLVALWVRSYWWADFMRGPLTVGIDYYIWSIRGHLKFGRLPWDASPMNTQRATRFGSFPSNRLALEQPMGRSRFGFKLVRVHTPGTNKREPATIIPFWMPVLMMLSTALAVWVLPAIRFSLRTLLIATTLVAIGLGGVIYLAR